MKKVIIISALALGAMFSSSCEKAVVEEVVMNRITFSAGISEVSKAAVDGLDIKWQEGDSIMCFDEDGNPFDAAFVLEKGAGTIYGEFSYSGTSVKTPVYAIYPYSACNPEAKIDLAASNIYAGLTIPSKQDGTSSQMIMFAEPKKGEGTVFKSLGCVVKMTVPADLEVSQMTVTVTSPEGAAINMFGPAQITSGRRLSVSSGTGSGKTNSCVIDNEATISGDVYVVLGATNSSTAAKLSVNFGKSDYSVAEVSGNLNSSLSTGKLKNLGTVANLEFDKVGDYYNWFDKGFNLKIGDKVYNKTNVKYTLTTDAASFATAVSGGSLVFMGSDVRNYSSNLNFSKDIVLIGRDRSSQATLDFSGKYMFAKTASVVLKNLSLSTSSTTCLISNNGTGVNPSLFVEDCTVKSAGRFIYEQDTDNVFENVSVNNCVISFAGSNGMYGIAEGKSNEKDMKSISFNNNVIYTASALNTTLINFQKNNSGGTTYAFDSLVFEFTHNSVCNVFNSAIMKFGSIKQAVIDNNAGQCDLSGLSGSSSCLVGFTAMGGLEPNTSSIRGNWFYKSAGEGKKWQDVNSAYQPGFTRSGNKMADNVSPFKLIDTVVGYIPVDPAVTTAGATYSTKLWEDWN